MTKATKKGGSTALQTEVANDEEWEQIRERKGLVLVEIYSEWSGPCLAMLSTLRKIKMENGGDILTYGLAKNDFISSLERFRKKSEPVWMFLQDGKIVNLMLGANCPNLRRLILSELKRVQDNEPPRRKLSVTRRVSVEEARWRKTESVRQAKEKFKMAQEAAAKKSKYEEYLAQEMFELCEETAIVLYPWIFLDEDGKQRDKENCPAYTELVREIFPERFDVSEQIRIQLDEEKIKKMFVESNVEITDHLIEGLTQDKCLAMRLRAKPPPSSWPVSYPYECPDGTIKCPRRAINDVEIYLRNILEEPLPEDRNSIEGNYFERHFYVYEFEEESKEENEKIFPAVWFPPQARSKVHVFKTLFANYMEKAHPYEEPIEPPPLCGFKFDATKFSIIQDVWKNFDSAIEKFGVFEFDAPSVARRVASNPQDFEIKVNYKTGAEIFVIVVRRINEEVFLAFAGNEPFFVTEDNEEAVKMIAEYFPPGAIDVIPEVPGDDEDSYENWEGEDEDEEEDEEDEEKVENSYPGISEVPPSFIDLSMF